MYSTWCIHLLPSPPDDPFLCYGCKDGETNPKYAYLRLDVLQYNLFLSNSVETLPDKVDSKNADSISRILAIVSHPIFFFFFNKLSKLCIQSRLYSIGIRSFDVTPCFFPLPQSPSVPTFDQYGLFLVYLFRHVYRN